MHRLATYEVPDRRFRASLVDWAESAQIELEFLRSPMFLTSGDEWASYVRGTHRRRMSDFYMWQRKRLNLLMDRDEPVGGRWSFDDQNRRPVPRGLKPPAEHWASPDELTRQVIELVEDRFADHEGRARDFGYAVTHAEAEEHLDHFLQERFANFGPYEDAISQDHAVLWHSVLTPYLNTGLLTPSLVLDRAMMAAEQYAVPLPSVEGFVRQIIGWREFIRRIADEYPDDPMVRSDFAHHRRQLTPAWYTGETGLPPLDTVIRRVQRHGWCHHIERLMVLGSAMLMCEVSPGAAYRWFMEMFIDSAEWVMAPNVLGMSQFADGGVFATKPYFSASAYLRKMSDYPPGDWCEVWDGLYWRFVHVNRKFFAQNPRLAQIARGVDRLKPDRRERIFGAAEQFIARVTTE